MPAQPFSHQFSTECKAQTCRQEGDSQEGKSALTGVAQRSGMVPQSEQVASLVPGQGSGPGPRWGARERQPIDVFLPPFLSKNG